MKTSEKALAGIVVIMLIVWGLLSLTKKAPRTATVPKAGMTTQAPAPEDTQLAMEPMEKIIFENIPDEKDISRTWDLVCDPFIKLELEKKKAPGAEKIPKLILEGVIWSETPPRLAVINDTSVAEGDVISGFKIEEIQKDRVILSKDGNEYIIELWKGEE